MLLATRCGPDPGPLTWTPQGFAGTWCWESGPETRRPLDNLPYHTFKLRLEQRGRILTGYHCAVASWGNRVDCALPDQDEPSIYGKIHDGYALLEVRSTYTEITMDARLVPTLIGLRWEPLSAAARVMGPGGQVFWADWYMPWVKVEMCPCDWLEGDEAESPCEKVPARSSGPMRAKASPSI